MAEKRGVAEKREVAAWWGRAEARPYRSADCFGVGAIVPMKPKMEGFGRKRLQGCDSRTSRIRYLPEIILLEKK